MNAPTDLQVIKSGGFSLVPETLTQAMELAKLIADSDLAPKDYRNKPGNVLIAVQMGSEVGLSPMSAIQNIAVINGKPSLYGDAGKALLLQAGFVIEEDDTQIVKKNGMARCRITRPGHPPCERTFSLSDAQAAGLIGKQGPWTNYKERQMAWRAFWFCARDVAADVLKGLRGAEEVQDYVERDITPQSQRIESKVEAKELPQYSEASFGTYLPKWSKLIIEGKKTAAEVIATASLKGILSDEQKKAIEAVKKPEATNTDTGETESLLDKVKRLCKLAIDTADTDTAWTKLDDARFELKEMSDENRVLGVAEIDAAEKSIKARGQS